MSRVCSEVDAYVCVFFKQNTAYEMRISDWSSDVCSSDLLILCRLSSRFTHLPKCTTISARSDTVGSFLALTVPLRIPSTAALPTLPHAVNCRVDGLPKSPLNG